METIDNSITEADENISDDDDEIEDIGFVRKRRSPDPNPQPRGVRKRKLKQKKRNKVVVDKIETKANVDKPGDKTLYR